MFSPFLSLSLRLFAFGLLISAICIVPSQQIRAQTSAAALSASEDESIRHALQSLDSDESTQYIAVSHDLSGNGGAEVIAYMLGDQWCGSGGCSTFILAKKGASWKVVSKISNTRTPIRVLPETSHGWHSIGVLVAGGGITKAYEAVLRFDGKSYPRNPTVPPATRANAAVGEVLIPSTQNAKALYP